MEGRRLSQPDLTTLGLRAVLARPPAHGHAGTGIGLAIVSELARAHGGRAEADSRPAEGATFRVLLPQA